MKDYQDTETGKIWAFEDGVDPFKLSNRNIPTTLSETVIPKPSESHVWFEGHWVEETEVPEGYKPPISSVPAYNPAWVAFLRPYTVICNEKPDISFEQIVLNLYDKDQLSRAVVALPLDKSTRHALVSYDGAIAIPRDGSCPSNEAAIDALNKMLCAILLGGIHTEVLSYQDLLCGSLNNIDDIFIYNPLSHTPHARLRHKEAPFFERLQFLQNPRTLPASDLLDAFQHGILVMDSVRNLSPFFLLHGYTAMVNHNYGDALSSLWIVVEQITSFLWTNKFMNKSQFHPSVSMKKRKDSMNKDNRTWSISVKHELLWQTKLISDECYAALSVARNQRNNLVHEGIIPNFSAIKDLWHELSELFETASGISQERLKRLIPIDTQNLGSPENTNFDEWEDISRKLDHGTK